MVKESILTLNIQEVDKEKKFIPVHIDKSFFKIDAQSTIINSIDEAINEIDVEIEKIKAMTAPTTNLYNKRSQLMEFRFHIDKILLNLNKSFSCDMSNDTEFTKNLSKLIELLKK